jgi:hypothetical protein
MTTEFRKPGAFPMKPQAARRRGSKRHSRGVQPAKTYGKRPCPGCSAPISQYSPDPLCRLCTVRRES